MDTRLDKRGIFLIISLAVVIYFNSFWVNFIWDDTALIVDNPLVKSISNIRLAFSNYLSVHTGNFYRPMQTVSYIFDFFLYKFNYKGYHLTNIILHILTAVLAYKLLLLTTNKRKLSLYSVLLFTACPLWVETVTYISGRADMLMAIFIIFSFIYFIEGKIFLTLIFYLFALFSKEASLIFPFLVLFYILILSKRSKRSVYCLVLLFLLTFLYILFRFAAFGLNEVSHSGIPLGSRLVIALQSFSGYARLLFFPLNQHMVYAVRLPVKLLSITSLTGALVLSVSVYLFRYYLKRNKVLAFFIGWFFIFLMPQLGILSINAFFSEHFIYLASLGFFVNLVYLLLKIKNKVLFNSIFLGYLALFSFATINYNFVWQDPIKVFERVIKFSPGNFTGYNNLGIIFMEQGNFTKGEELIKKAYELNPEDAEARLNLARIYYFKNDYKAAIKLAELVLEKDPKNYFALNYLGTFYFKKGNLELAQKYYEEAIKVNPQLISLKKDLYLFYKSTGNQAKADELFSKIEAEDKYAVSSIYYDASISLFESAELDKALSMVDKAIAVDNQNLDFYNLKGSILRRKGDFKQSFESFKRACEVAPFRWETYNNLGNLFAVAKDYARAEGYFKKSLNLNDANADTYFNLGLLYFYQNEPLKAKDSFEKCLSLNPSHSLAKEYLIKVKPMQKK